MFSAEDGSVWLAPTRLALALAGGSPGQMQHEVTDGFIVVETNYRVRSLAPVLRSYTVTLSMDACVVAMQHLECPYTLKWPRVPK